VNDNHFELWENFLATLPFIVCLISTFYWFYRFWETLKIRYIIAATVSAVAFLVLVEYFGYLK